ncbi:MAG: DUF1761 domain-containing protein [Ignavibacteria bacterium]|nr:DUF1761 domain-containing protein [Ignavibacteria bacterium]MBL7993564.1 DUF1761 domain-containing protein [Candidatus Kapabacteria bacterium]
MKALKINFVAIAVLAVAFQLTNVAWYSLAGDRWVELSGLKNVADIAAATSPLAYLSSIITSALFCFMLAWLFTKIRVETALQGIIYAVSFYGCFVFFESMTKDMFHLRPFMLTLINEGVNFINYTLAGAVLGVWRKYEA